MLLFHSQIMQTEGSYSFLLCGMIIACIGFILFIGLLLFQRMHRNYLTGTLWARTFLLLLLISHQQTLILSICTPKGTTKKSAMVEEAATEQNGSARTEQKEGSSTSWGLFCSSLATVASKLLQQSVIQTVIFKLWIGVSFYIATGFEINCNCDYMLNTLILSAELIFFLKN